MSTIEVKIDLQMTESYRRPSRGEGTSKINILQSKAPTAMNTGSFASIDKTCRKSPQLRFQNNYWRLQLEGVLQTKTKVHLNAFKITLFSFFFQVNKWLQDVQMTPDQQPALSEHEVRRDKTVDTTWRPYHLYVQKNNCKCKR